jgi:hypothetical protein
LALAIGWQSLLPEIRAAGRAARISEPFDDRARQNQVAIAVANARKFAIWPFVVGAAFFFVGGFGPILGGLTVILGGYLAYRAISESRELGLRLEDETRRLRATSEEESSRLKEIVSRADSGDLVALQFLLMRWTEHLPSVIKQVDAEVSASSENVLRITVTGVPRTRITQMIPRVGRGGKTFQDKRKAGDIDQDLAELNAGIVLSLLTALFAGSSGHKVDVCLAIEDSATQEYVPWVVLVAGISGSLLASTLNETSAVAAMNWLGGNVGRCRNQRLTAASVASNDADPASIHEFKFRATQQREQPYQTTGLRVNVDAPLSHPAAVYLGEKSGARGRGGLGSALGSALVPPIPAHVRANMAVSAIVSSPAGSTGEFASMARQYVSVEGNESATFAPFQAYWPSYSQMDRAQLAFYFKWRSHARRGEAPQTELSYIFVHVYELLHVIGAANADDAAQQLERVWLAYRTTFPKLDNYIVRWTADLYAKEVNESAAIAFMRRALTTGASPRGEELLLVTDSFWAKADYTAMPSETLSILTGDARLGENKFYREHNKGPSGDSWVSGAYRDALFVADDVYSKISAMSPREAEIKRFGLQPLTREPFQGAVYDWKRVPITLGKVPRLSERGEAVTLYRNAVRYAENLLRKERGFSGRLRGVVVSPDLARALDVKIATYIRSTRPRTRVTIDLAKAENLSRDSADVRARLLEGLDSESVNEVEQTVIRIPKDQPAASAALLTDLPAVQRALAAVSLAAYRLLETLMKVGWELESNDPTILAATAGALVTPLVDEINQSALAIVGEILIVHEDEKLVVQDDFRDEIYWVFRGTLEGFGLQTSDAPLMDQPHQSKDVVTVDAMLTPPEVDGFGPIELQALAIVTEPAGQSERTVQEFATERGLRPLLIFDRINEIALTSPYGDILLDTNASPPSVMPDAVAYVNQILDQFRTAQQPVAII